MLKHEDIVCDLSIICDGEPGSILRWECTCNILLELQYGIFPILKP